MQDFPLIHQPFLNESKVKENMENDIEIIFSFGTVAICERCQSPFSGLSMTYVERQKVTHVLFGQLNVNCISYLTILFHTKTSSDM